MSKYDFYIAGRWRNKDNIIPILNAVRDAGKTAYCFIDNEYSGDKVEFKIDDNPEEFMSTMEGLYQNDKFVRKVFEIDMEAQRNSEYFLLVLPAGISGHIEAGAAYGMGKKCYAIGKTEKTETLYCIFDKIFKDKEELTDWLKTPEIAQRIDG